MRARSACLLAGAFSLGLATAAYIVQEGLGSDGRGSEAGRGGRGGGGEACGSLARAFAITYIYEEGCPECEEVSACWLPVITEGVGACSSDVGKYVVSSEQGRERLFALERELGFRAEVMAPVLIVHGEALCGLEAIERYARGLR